MFGKNVEIENLNRLLAESRGEQAALEREMDQVRKESLEAREELRDIKWKLSTVEKEAELLTEKKLNDLRKSMQESLIKSDLLRTEALARLEIYEKTDTKADANTIKDMVKQLIDVVGKQSLNVISTGNK